MATCKVSDYHYDVSGELWIIPDPSGIDALEFNRSCNPLMHQVNEWCLESLPIGSFECRGNKYVIDDPKEAFRVITIWHGMPFEIIAMPEGGWITAIDRNGQVSFQ